MHVFRLSLAVVNCAVAAASTVFWCTCALNLAIIFTQRTSLVAMNFIVVAATIWLRSAYVHLTSTATLAAAPSLCRIVVLLLNDGRGSVRW